MRIRLPGTALDGGNYQRTGEGWKSVILEAGIDDYLARHSRKTAAKP
ncbi:MAG TPA: hypothetical protein VGD81_09680 [Opitutaceae bacterium]